MATPTDEPHPSFRTDIDDGLGRPVTVLTLAHPAEGTIVTSVTAGARPGQNIFVAEGQSGAPIDGLIDYQERPLQGTEAAAFHQDVVQAVRDGAYNGRR